MTHQHVRSKVFKFRVDYVFLNVLNSGVFLLKHLCVAFLCVVI